MTQLSKLASLRIQNKWLNKDIAILKSANRFYKVMLALCVFVITILLYSRNVQKLDLKANFQKIESEIDLVKQLDGTNVYKYHKQ